MDIGARVRQLRQDRGFTLRELADKSNLTLNSVGRIERGERTPSSVTVEKLARGLGVDPGELFESPLVVASRLS